MFSGNSCKDDKISLATLFLESVQLVPDALLRTIQFSVLNRATVCFIPSHPRNLLGDAILWYLRVGVFALRNAKWEHRASVTLSTVIKTIGTRTIYVTRRLLARSKLIAETEDRDRCVIPKSLVAPFVAGDDVFVDAPFKQNYSLHSFTRALLVGCGDVFRRCIVKIMRFPPRTCSYRRHGG